MILIKKGNIVDPVTNKDFVADILIEENIIKKIKDDIDPSPFKQSPDFSLIDASKMTIIPGLTDTHVHFRDPGFTYKEDILSGSKAAAKGGVTTVVCMANTKPAVDNAETLKYIINKGKETDIRLYTTATVTKDLKGKTITDMEDLAKEGAIGFTDDGIPILDEKILLEAMNRAKKLDMPISLHEEDPLFVYQAGVNKGTISEKLNYGGAHRTAEDVMVARDCVLALHTGAAVCIQHISSKNSVEIVRLFKKLGANIHAEATPHHFTLTEDAVLEYGTNARMNPPLRTAEDRDAIIEGLKDGTIDMIVTDHAPHSREEKNKELAQAPSGITGLETSFSLGLKSLVEPGHISLMKLIEYMSTNPAKFYHLEPASISQGALADLVIFNPDQSWICKDFASKASNSPFLNWQLPGKIHYTICNGKIIYQA